MTPSESHDLSKLRVLFSTGSPLMPEDYDYVYNKARGAAARPRPTNRPTDRPDPTTAADATRCDAAVGRGGRRDRDATRRRGGGGSPDGRLQEGSAVTARTADGDGGERRRHDPTKTTRRRARLVCAEGGGRRHCRDA